MERFGKYNVVGIKHHLSSHQIRYNTKLIFCKKSEITTLVGRHNLGVKSSKETPDIIV